MSKANFKTKQYGFTLVEIIVATAIFTVVISGILTLFNSALKINRKVQAIRQVAQASRSFTETLSREIRNGRIDYSSSNEHCSGDYSSSGNQSLALVTFSGDRLCFYYDINTSTLFLRRETSTSVTEESITPSNITINFKNFRFFVRPQVDPVKSNKGIQPMVTILAEFYVNQGTRDQIIIPYQTSISTDIYDSSYVPHAP